MAMSLVARALSEEQLQAENMLSRADAELCEVDLRYKAHSGFLNALDYGYWEARAFCIQGRTLFQDIAPVEVRNDIADIIQLHKTSLVRYGSSTRSAFLDGVIVSLLHPISWNAMFSLTMVVLDWAARHKRADEAARSSIMVRQLPLARCAAGTRAQCRAAGFTLSLLAVLSRRL